MIPTEYVLYGALAIAAIGVWLLNVRKTEAPKADVDNRTTQLSALWTRRDELLKRKAEIDEWFDRITTEIFVGIIEGKGSARYLSFYRDHAAEVVEREQVTAELKQVFAKLKELELPNPKRIQQIIDATAEADAEELKRQSKDPFQ